MVAALGGALQQTLKEVFEPFEKQYSVTIRWVPVGSSVENVARAAATRQKPEFDLVIGENQSHYTGSVQGLWAPIDEKIVTNYKDQLPMARVPSNDVVNFGFYVAGVFYAYKEFEKRGWTAPTHWSDLFRKEFCGRVGINNVSVSYGLYTLIMISDADPAKVPDGVAKLAANKSCIPVLEPTPAKLEEKILLGDYLIGVHGSVRAIPLIKKGTPIKFRIPDEGTVIASSSVSAVKDSPNPRMAQEFLNWILRPDVQAQLMQKAFYSPTNRNVKVPPELVELGVPDAAVLQRSLRLDEKVVDSNRRQWIRQVERAME